jgi:Flp pilus assembly protein TadG
MRGPAQALVEFALAISVFMLLVLGTFDLARAYLAYTVVANVAREASRYGAAHISDPTDLADAVQAGRNLAVGIDSSALTLTAVTRTIDALPYVNVKGTYQFHTLTPGVAALLGNTITLTVDTSALAG